ncbi:Glutamate 5-kinase [bacterium HR19]|nr:Glutamate 5-kinase [bacterium HR19]
MLVVLKIGSSVLEKDGEPDEKIFDGISNVISECLEGGKAKFVIVSSGAMLFGIMEAGLKKAGNLIRKQALCAIGQPKLMNMWEKSLSKYGLKPAQILLVHDDFASKERSQNVKNTIEEIIKMNFIPIVNENDPVSTEEIKLGDNDFLSVYLSALISAEKLIIASDIDGVIDESGKVIEEINFEDKEIWQKIKTIKRKKRVSSGGITSKLSATKLASEFGIESFIVNGKNPENIKMAVEGKKVGTRIIPGKKYPKKILWIGNVLRCKGKLEVDEGAFNAIVSGKSLLPSGIIKVSGNFSRGDMIELEFNRKTFAKGISNYSSAEINLIKGKKTSDIEKILGYKREDEIIHRDNMMILLG